MKNFLKPRVLYLTRYQRYHDVQFIRRLYQHPLIDFVCVLLQQEVPDELKGLQGLKVFSIYDGKFPIDDPHRKGYNFWSQQKLQLARAFYARRLREVALEFEPTVVHSCWTQIDTAVAVKANIAPVLMMPLGTDILINPFQSAAAMQDAQNIIRKTAYVTCDARLVKQKILEIDPNYPQDRFLIFPWGVDTERFKPRSPDHPGHKLKLIMTRNYYEVYNVPFFIHVVKELLRKGYEFDVSLIGDGPLRDEVHQTIENLGLQNSIQMLGCLPNSEVAAALQASDIYVSTSLSDGTSVSLLEAMATGMGIVVSDIAANREWIVQEMNGLLADPRNKEDFVHQIAKLMDAKDTLLELGSHARKTALARADFASSIEQLVRLYYRLSEETLCRSR